jgi:hypothetical protein
MKKECCKHVHVTHALFKELSDPIAATPVCSITTSRPSLESYDSKEDSCSLSHDSEAEKFGTYVEDTAMEEINMDRKDNYNQSININLDEKINKVLCSLKQVSTKELDKLNANISSFKDNALVKRVNEEIHLLNDFIEFSISETPNGMLEIDNDMKKKQKTQRSWFTKK